MTTSSKTKKTTRAKKIAGFSVDEYVVYPTHGVGRITGIEEQEFAVALLKLFVVDFDKEKMTLRVPITKATQTGMRSLSVIFSLSN